VGRQITGKAIQLIARNGGVRALDTDLTLLADRR
jgi:hypothetical protein